MNILINVIHIMFTFWAIVALLIWSEMSINHMGKGDNDK
jgi:hypothetical protein